MLHPACMQADAWATALGVLDPVAAQDLARRNALMARFCNAALMHRTRQIAIDGSQKLPQRLLATAADRLAAGLGIKATALGVAAWMRWQSGLTEGGERFEVDDPLAAETARRLAEADNEADQVLSLLRLAAVFP